MGPLLDYEPIEISKLKKEDLRNIKGKDFALAMRKIKPSYAKSKVNRFIEWEKSLTV